MPRGVVVILWLVIVTATVAQASAVQAQDRDLLWGFMNRFITPDGAVVDTQNQNMSHSEGQGYGMLIALAADDRRRFEQIWQWTQTHLAVRDDGLLAWSWDREENRIADANAAIDGDILVAWALLRGAQRWKSRYYRDAALEHLDAIQSQVVQYGGHWLLKPGPSGFMLAGEALHINLSYWVFPALEAFSQAHDGPWKALLDDGLKLSRQLLDRYRVIPDWVRVQLNGDLALSNIVQAPGRSGFDAIRIPMYLHWAGQGSDIAQHHWQRMQRPASSGQQILVRASNQSVVYMTGQHAGYAAIGALVDPSTPRWPSATLAHDYYPAALQLLSRMAAAEGGLR